MLITGGFMREEFLPLSGSDQGLLFDLIDVSHMKGCALDEDIYPLLRKLLDYECYGYGTVNLDADRKLRTLGGNIPDGGLDKESSSRGSTLNSLVKAWLAVGSPVYLNEPGQNAQGPCALSAVHRRTFVLHGVTDAARRSATWYAFTKATFTSRDEYIIRVVVPHLHSTLVAATERMAGMGVTAPLTPREKEVLHWLAMGKANAEISIVLGISVCTVRVHIQSIFNKLSANNRTHAAARAMQLGLVGGRPKERETVPFSDGIREF